MVKAEAAVLNARRRLEPYLAGTARVPELVPASARVGLWRSLLGALRRPASPEVVAVLSGTVGAARRYRCDHLVEQLRTAGFDARLCESDARSLSEASEVARAAVLHRVPWSAEIARLVDAVHRAGGSAWFNLDDLLFRRAHVNHLTFSGVRAEQDAEEHRQLADRYFETLSACDGVIASTESLAHELRHETAMPVHVVRNAASDEMLRRSERARAEVAPFRDGAVVLGYLSGTPTHDRDFATALPALVRLLRERAETALVLVGFADANGFPEDVRQRVLQLPFQDWRQLPGLMRRLDLVLAPLETPNRFTECKSEVKYLEAGLVGVPTVATATEAFTEAIEDGKSGYLVRSARAEEWFAKLAQACADPRRRAEIGAAALRDCLRRYTPRARAPVLASLLRARM